jgi:phosphoglycerate kinase
MEREQSKPRLRGIQQADMKGKVVLVRVDHNVVKKGRIKDPYRIDATFATLYAIAEKGGRPILMTHVGRPKDKKTGKITCTEGESVAPIVQYLEQKLPVTIHIPEFPIDPEKGIVGLNGSVKADVEKLKEGKIQMMYLPNTRWFQGEEAKGPERELFAKELASLGDLYVNDAFGSWQAHASTYDIARLLPSFAGTLLQREIAHLDRVLHPERPFVAVIAGAKYDTKIGPLKALYDRVDALMLGGLMYNTFLSAKYGVGVEGVSEEDRALAAQLMGLDAERHKILEMPYVVESDTMEGKSEGRYKPVSINDLKQGQKRGYLLDIAPESFEMEKVRGVIGSARTIFVNAVMGFMPHFWEGSQALYGLIFSNKGARKLFGGGDTLQELRNLCPGAYMGGLDDPDTYYFTGGGTVLSAIEQGGPYGLKPIEALLEKG